MIHATWREIRDRNVSAALQNLSVSKGISFATTLKVVAMLKGLTKEITKSNEVAAVVQKKYGTKDEKTGMWTVKPEHKEDFVKADEEFMATPCEFRFAKLTIKELEGSGITAADLFAIDFLVEEPKEKADLKSVPAASVDAPAPSPN